jgi:hypothetical protein
MSDSIKNQLQTDHEQKSQDQYSLGFTEKLSGVDLGIFSFGASSDQKFTWTSSSTDGDLTDSSQTATATVVCPSTTYQGPTIMSIYWDKLFGSFMFEPTVLASPQIAAFHKGTVINTAGKPVQHAAVTLSIANKTYHTWTDNHGDYVFFRAAALGNVGLEATGQLSIKGVHQPVTLGSGQKIQIHVP